MKALNGATTAVFPEEPASVVQVIITAAVLLGKTGAAQTHLLALCVVRQLSGAMIAVFMEAAHSVARRATMDVVWTTQ